MLVIILLALIFLTLLVPRLMRMGCGAMFWLAVVISFLALTAPHH